MDNIGNKKMRERTSLTYQQLLDRLMDLFDAKNESDLCEKSGIGRSTLGGWKRRGSLPKLSVMIDIAHRTGVSLDALLLGRRHRTGEDDRDLSAGDSLGMPSVTGVEDLMASIAARSTSALDAGSLEDRVAAVFRAEINLHAEMAALQGYLADHPALTAAKVADPQPVDVVEWPFASSSEAQVQLGDVSGRLWFRRAWLDQHGLVASRCVVIAVDGDSMEPTLMNGAKIMIDRVRTHWRAGDIFAIRAPEGLMVKRAGSDKDGKPLMLSDNPLCGSADLPDGAQIVGQVVWTARTLVDGN